MALPEQTPPRRPAVAPPAAASSSTPFRTGRFEIALPRAWTLTRWLGITVALLVIASTIGQVIRLRYGYTYLLGLIPLSSTSTTKRTCPPGTPR